MNPDMFHVNAVKKTCLGCGMEFITKWQKLKNCYDCRHKHGSYTLKEKRLLKKTTEEKEQEKRDLFD